ncbi:MAG: hypothetical protein IJJ86_05555 [Clostridia bacterium]|nr:hypothetical protein [Clostridia bacterium]
MKLKLPEWSVVEQWRQTYERERGNLSPNAITGDALIAFAEKRFGAVPFENEAFENAVRTDVLNNAFFRDKLNGNEPDPVVLRLYDGTFLGVDRVSGWFLAENDAIRDELTVVKGLDEADLGNVVRTVDYLRCKKTYGARMKELKKRRIKRAGAAGAETEETERK